MASLAKKLRSQLKTPTNDGAIKLTKAWRDMECDNAILVDWNDVLTEYTGSNTAPYLLGAGQNAAAALFYLVKYLSKESGEMPIALSVMLDALQHIGEHGSRAADAGTPQRSAQHLLQRTLNKCDTELAITQATAMLIGTTPSGCSESFVFVDMWAAAAHAEAVMYSTKIIALRQRACRSFCIHDDARRQ